MQKGASSLIENGIAIYTLKALLNYNDDNYLPCS